jgi:hypothetical protein
MPGAVVRAQRSRDRRSGARPGSHFLPDGVNRDGRSGGSHLLTPFSSPPFYLGRFLFFWNSPSLPPHSLSPSCPIPMWPSTGVQARPVPLFGRPVPFPLSCTSACPEPFRVVPASPYPAQLDGAPPSISALPAIAAALQGSATETWVRLRVCRARPRHNLSARRRAKRGDARHSRPSSPQSRVSPCKASLQQTPRRSRLARRRAERSFGSLFPSISAPSSSL